MRSNAVFVWINGNTPEMSHAAPEWGRPVDFSETTANSHFSRSIRAGDRQVHNIRTAAGPDGADLLCNRFRRCGPLLKTEQILLVYLDVAGDFHVISGPDQRQRQASGGLCLGQ